MAILRQSARASRQSGGLARTALAAIMFFAVAGGALATPGYDNTSDKWFWRDNDWEGDDNYSLKEVPLDGLSLSLNRAPTGIQAEADDGSLNSIPADIRAARYYVQARSFSIESGEPLAYPKMARTVWRQFIADRSGRVVVTTSGTRSNFVKPLNTMVGVYRKNEDGTGTLIAKNQVPMTGDSYDQWHGVQFDVVKGERYAIQMGSHNSQGGIAGMSLISFGPGGGLAVLPPEDYLCIRKLKQTEPCSRPSYRLYNAMKFALRVSASVTGLGARVKLPEPFVLKPGAAVDVSIDFDDVRGEGGKALNGKIAFSGERGGKVVARTVLSAGVVVHDGSQPTPALKISAQAKTIFVQQGTVAQQIVRVTNAGSVPARGCYVRRARDVIDTGWEVPDIQTAWAGYDASTGLVSTAPYTPFDVAPGDTISIVVATNSVRDWVANGLYYAPRYEIGCASGPSFPAAASPDLTNVLDVTAMVKPYPKISLVSTSPESGMFDVAPGGSVMTATFRNDSKTTALVTGRVQNGQKFSGSPRETKVSLCPAATTDAECLGSTTGVLDISIPAGETVTLKVGVMPPRNGGSGSNPKWFGLSLILTQPAPLDVNGYWVPISGVTKAINLQ